MMAQNEIIIPDDILILTPLAVSIVGDDDWLTSTSSEGGTDT